MDDLRVGLTLPTFSTEPDRLVAVARSAEQRGLDGVFTYDHLFRLSAAGDLRPALALEPVLGLLAAKTHRIVFGSLVARATVRRAAVLRLVLDTVERMAPGRLVAGIGSGDRESDPEQAMFGLIPEDPALRLSALERTLDSVTGRGYPVWVGGRSVSRAKRSSPTPHAFHPSAVTPTWGGLVELRPERWPEVAARPDVLAGGWDVIAERLRAFREAGAAWVILAPLDASDPANADVLADELLPRLEP